MKTQIWILLVIVAGTVQDAAGAECATKDVIFNPKSATNPRPWVAVDWDGACATFTAPVVNECRVVSSQLSQGVAANKPKDEVLFNFKKSATAFINANSSRQFMLSTQLHQDEANIWGTIQELFTCLATDCGILTFALSQPGEANKVGQKMREECTKFFATNVNEMLDCAYAAGEISGGAKAALTVLNEYTSNGNNTQRMNFLNTVTIEAWGGTAAQAIACSARGDCASLSSVLGYVVIDGIASTKFTDSMAAECAAKIPVPPEANNLKQGQCRVCSLAIRTDIGTNPADPIKALAGAYASCNDTLLWKADLNSTTLANWGTLPQAAACSGFVAPTTAVPDSTGTTAAPESAECQARRELLQKETSGEYRIIAPLLAQCQFMNSTEKAACESVTNTMRTIANSTSTEDKKLEDISNALTNYGIISPFKAVTLQTTDIGSWNATTRNYFKFIACQSPGSCKLSQMMFATLPGGESYVSNSIMTACERNNTNAVCTNLMNEIKRCTLGPMNFMPATEADRLVRAQFIVANSTTARLDPNAPFGEWGGSVDQFLKCKLA